MIVYIIDDEPFIYLEALSQHYDVRVLRELTISSLFSVIEDLGRADHILMNQDFAQKDTNIIQAIRDLRPKHDKRAAPIILYQNVRELNSDEALFFEADSYLCLENERSFMETLKGYQQVTSLLDYGRIALRSMDETKRVTDLLASFCPNPMLAGLGISEILLNAVEHGNLGLHADEKKRLLEDNVWLDEVARRMSLEANQLKYVDVIWEKSLSELKITVTDMGEGFDYQHRGEEIEKNTHQSGRGIGMAMQLTFKSLQYQGKGNQVIGIISLIQ